jgi:DNA-binding transcriptional LysR family regulator
MNIKDIEAFLTLADDLNFTKSAERLYISQPAFSRQITKIEDELGCELFVRNKRKVQLTEFGQTFLEYAENIYAENEKCLLHLKQLKTQKSGRLGIGFLYDLSNTIFSKIVRSFSSAHPNIELNFQDGSMAGIIEGLRRGSFDCAISLSTEIYDLSDIETLAISSLPECVVMSDTHELAARSSIRLEELKDENFVYITSEGYGPGARHFNYLCRRAGFKPNVVSFTSQVSSMLIMVQCGVGISFLAQEAKQIAPKGLAFIPLEDDYANIDTVLCWKKDNANPSLPYFIETAKSVIKEEAT